MGLKWQRPHISEGNLAHPSMTLSWHISTQLKAQSQYVCSKKQVKKTGQFPSLDGSIMVKSSFLAEFSQLELLGAFQVLRCDGMRAVPPALPVTRLADSAEGGDATVERLAGAPAWSKLMEVGYGGMALAKSIDTVDGRNPAPPWMVETL
jgi:hypothetical protein